MSHAFSKNVNDWLVWLGMNEFLAKGKGHSPKLCQDKSMSNDCMAWTNLLCQWQHLGNVSDNKWHWQRGTNTLTQLQTNDILSAYFLNVWLTITISKCKKIWNLTCRHQGCRHHSPYKSAAALSRRGMSSAMVLTCRCKGFQSPLPCKCFWIVKACPLQLSATTESQVHDCPEPFPLQVEQKWKKLLQHLFFSSIRSWVWKCSASQRWHGLAEVSASQRWRRLAEVSASQRWRRLAEVSASQRWPRLAEVQDITDLNWQWHKFWKNCSSNMGRWQEALEHQTPSQEQMPKWQTLASRHKDRREDKISGRLQLETSWNYKSRWMTSDRSAVPTPGYPWSLAWGHGFMVFQRRLSCTDTDSIDLSCRCSQFTWTQDPSTFFLEHVHPRCYCDDPQSSLKRLSRLSLTTAANLRWRWPAPSFYPGHHFPP